MIIKVGDRDLFVDDNDFHMSIEDFVVKMSFTTDEKNIIELFQPNESEDIIIEKHNHLFTCYKSRVTQLILEAIVGVSREEACRYNVEFVPEGIKCEELKDFLIE